MRRKPVKRYTLPNVYRKSKNIKFARSKKFNSKEFMKMTEWKNKFIRLRTQKIFSNNYADEEVEKNREPTTTHKKSPELIKDPFFTFLSVK